MTAPDKPPETAPQTAPQTAPEPAREMPSVLRLARASGGSMRVAPLDLGARVRALRRERGWTLEQAARAAGLARSTLSKIENGLMSPTYDALKKLADGLTIPVPQLFTPPSGDQVNGRMAMTRAGEGLAHPTRTYEHRLLAQSLTRKRMLPYEAVIRARSLDEFDGWVRHDGEEFLYVIKGCVRFFTEFYACADLGPGDSAYYDASMGHNVISIGPEDATILWVTSMD